MSNDEIEAIEAQYEKWDADEARHKFLSRMEKKLHRKERLGRT